MSLRGSYYWNGGPSMRADVSYSQTGRTASTATYSVTVSLYFTSGGWFGYGLVGTVTINGKSQSITFKNASPTWSGAGHKGTWTFNITANAGTGGGTLPASFRMLGQQGDSTDINTGSRTVSLSTWNTAPVWTGEGNVNNWSSSQIIPENTTTVTVNLPSASDKEGNTIYTDVARYVNGGRDKTVAGGTTARTLTDNISAVAQGAKIKYSFYMSDGSLYNPTTKYTVEHTKNRFTPATISANGAKIWYNTTEFNCSVGAATNLHSDKTFTYALLTNVGIKVYNPTVTGNFTLKIHKSGTAPTTPYILFSDLQNYYKTRGWTGSFNLVIYSENKFGSGGTNSTNVLVDLKVAPAPAVLNNPTGTTTVKGAAYYIPRLKNVVLSWSAATDKLGAGAISYKVHHKIGNNGWQQLGTTSGTTMTVPLETLSNISAQTSYSVKVEAVTVYGTSSMSAEKTITLHYYNEPKVYFTDYYRTETEFSVNVHTSTNTSIPTVAIVRRCWTHTEGTGEFAGSPYTYSLTGLNGGTNMWLIFEAYDDSGIDLGWGAGKGSAETSTGIYTPIMTMTDEGVYINVDPDNPKVSKRTLNVGGTFNGHGVYDYDTRVYSPMNKPSGSEIPYIPLTGTNGIIRNDNGGDCSLTFDRNQNANWKIINNGGFLRFQCDWNGSKGAYFNAVSIDHTTGNMAVNKGDLSVNAGKQMNASAFNLNGYKNWDSGGFNDTGGGAAIVNDNGTYKALMILGNRSAGGSRKIEMWDSVNINGPLSVNTNPIVSYKKETSSTHIKQSIRFYDGTAIEHCTTYISQMTLNTQAGAIWHSPTYTLGAWLRAFVDYPAISMTVSNTANFWYTGNKGESPIHSGSMVFFGAGGGTWNLNFYIHCIGIGRWKV